MEDQARLTVGRCRTPNNNYSTLDVIWYILLIYTMATTPRKARRGETKTVAATRQTAVLVRLTGSEKRRLKRASQERGLGLSTMLREVGLKEARRLV